jgi:uncharacterized protein
MIDFNSKKLEIEKVAKKHKLSLVALYGSYAKNLARKDSDIDLAIYRKGKSISFDELVDLNNEFADVFKSAEVDVKSLHNTNPLFRYQVMRDGVLLCGNRRDFVSFKAYAFRDYCDSKGLLRLKENIIKKRLKALTK